MFRRRNRYWLALLITVSGHLPTWAATHWHTLAAGLEYTSLRLGDASQTGALHAFRVDPAKYTFDLALARDYGLKTATVRELGERRKAVLAINGGFFSPDAEPLGLRLSRGVIQHPLKAVSWWSVFSIDKNRPAIVSPSQFQRTATMSFAVQSGPRLLVNGAIPSLKEGDADRSVLCITDTQRVIVAVTETAPIATENLALALRTPESAGGLGCVYAQNLDGGHSSQLYARLGKFQLHVPNLSPVTDAIVVVPR